MDNERTWCDRDESIAALIAVGAVFDSFHRVLLCLDSDLRVVHASQSIAALIGDEPAAAIVGSAAEELLGHELFGAGGVLRDVLERGELREGWRATIRSADGGMRLVSCSVAPFKPDPRGVCDPRVAYVIILRPAEEDAAVGTAAPTAFAGMIARSSAMARLFHLVENLQASDATILLTGESGTGKEVLAHAIHANSARKNGHFVATNCAALPSELLESELFGHVRGAFTGAIRDRIGRVEVAAGGTLFLDEIGDLPLHLQVKLLRFLQEKTFERVGDSHTRKADVRVIAATNVDLRKAIADGRFREDLYYRLRVVPIEIPPLRSRREDVEPLARYLLARVAARHGREMRSLAKDARSGTRRKWSKGLGVRVGYLAQPLPKLQIGASFTPMIKMSKFGSYCGLFAQDGRFNIPESLNAGVAYRLTEALTADVDYQRIHYSDVASVGDPLLPNLVTSPLGSNGGAGFGWRDINVYKLGLQWKANPTWTWRAGYSRADQPIPSSEVLFNILAPGVVQDHITFGFSKAIERSAGRFNVALMYAPPKTVTGANPLEAPGAQQIQLKMHEFELEFGYSFGF
ncbi:MAG TPA: sigma 54-interacting transcriptional regulator [Thermoanaerobaculia bacterium]|nr:sigma 54-interacting transcriptional regulator [Thermoanaerobaculia bacterium]